jgi:hypothetical protein
MLRAEVFVGRRHRNTVPSLPVALTERSFRVSLQVSSITADGAHLYVSSVGPRRWSGVPSVAVTLIAKMVLECSSATTLIAEDGSGVSVGSWRRVLFPVCSIPARPSAEGRWFRKPVYLSPSILFSSLHPSNRLSFPSTTLSKHHGTCPSLFLDNCNLSHPF